MKSHITALIDPAPPNLHTHAMKHTLCVALLACLSLSCNRQDNTSPKAKPTDTPTPDYVPTPFVVPEGCAYEQWADHYISCNDHQTQVWEMQTLEPSEACPTYYSINVQAWSSVSDLAIANDCDTTCDWTARIAVMFVHCGFRGEYIGYSAADESCGDINYFVHSTGEGWYDTFEDFQEAHPCP